MEQDQLDEISNGIETLRKSMKNLMEISFAISPLMILSSHGWMSPSCHSVYLLKVSVFVSSVSLNVFIILQTFVALGNNRPQILVKLENCVLGAIMDISQGKSRDNAIENLYSQLSSMEDELCRDNDALTWFNLGLASKSSSTSQSTSFSNSHPFSPSTPPPAYATPDPNAGRLIS